MYRIRSRRGLILAGDRRLLLAGDRRLRRHVIGRRWLKPSAKRSSIPISARGKHGGVEGQGHGSDRQLQADIR
jgi:hypothetical protein